MRLRRDDCFADWSRSAAMRCLTSGQRPCGLKYFAPGLGNPSEMLTVDSLGRARMRASPSLLPGPRVLASLTASIFGRMNEDGFDGCVI